MPFLDHFSLVAPFYERIIPFREPDRLLELLELPVDGPLLDAAGGTGRVAQAVVGRASAVILADEAPGMLLQAGRKPGVAPANARIERLPFASQTFARILMVDALHHVANQSEAACELWRVLRPGGRIVIMEPDRRLLIVKFIVLAEKLALMRSHFLSPPRIEALFAFPYARKTTFREGFNAYIVIDKLDR